MDKKSFLLYTDKLDVLDDMSDEDVGKLFRAIVSYVNTGAEPERGTIISIAFRGIKSGIDFATEKYERLCIKNRENGRRGGRPKADNIPEETKQNPKNPTVILGNENKSKRTQRLFSIKNKNPSEPNKTLTDTDTDTDTTLSNERDMIPKGILSGKPDDISQNSDTPPQKKDKHASARKEIIDYLNVKLGSKYTYTSQATNKHINARLEEGHTVDDFKTVIDKKIKSWYNDPTMRIYLRPETLFGNKFDGYLNELDAPKTYEKLKSEEFDYETWERTHDIFGNPIGGTDGTA